MLAPACWRGDSPRALLPVVTEGKTMNLSRAVILAAALPASATAQQETRSEPPAAQAPEARTTPEMNGHVFAPSLLVDTPFRETTFKLGILYGFGSATGPRYEVQGNPPQVVQNGTNDYTFASFAQVFRYEYRFTEWLSGGVAILTNLYSGINGPSVVSIGANVGVGAGLRVRAGHRFGPVETAIIVDASTAPEYGFLVAAALAKAIQDGVIDAGSALQATHTLTVTPTAAASWAPWPALGLTLNGGYVYKSLRLNSTNIADQGGLQFAAMADFDFGKISSVPIGLTAAYKLTAPLGDSGVSKVQDISGGIAYTARKEIGLGLEAGWRSFTIREPLNSTEGLVQLGLQYYW
jgi:hypothetical protein